MYNVLDLLVPNLFLAAIRFQDTNANSKLANTDNSDNGMCMFLFFAVLQSLAYV